MDVRGLVDRLLPGTGDADRSSADAGRAADEETTVAIACQGGGSHAAFTAGALGYLLEHLPPSYRCCGISGTSGGAVCAATAWYGFVTESESPSDRLESVWMDVAATSRWDQWVNSVAVSKVERTASGSGPVASPYGNPGSDWGKRHLERVLTDHVDFERFPDLIDDEDDAPALLVGAVDVETGAPRVFADEEVTADAVLASAAIPSLFEAVAVDDDHYWDGLFGKNPPVRDFLTCESVPPVDELWVVQLTPQRAESVPTTASEIDDRMRQLVGNVSLQQELAFVEAVNEWVREDRVDAPGLTETTVRTISLYEEQAANSTVDRDADFVRDLLADGRAEAVGFLNAVAGADDPGQSM